GAPSGRTETEHGLTLEVLEPVMFFKHKTKYYIATLLAFRRVLFRSIMISHLHGDHILGSPGLLQTMSSLIRDKPLDLYGPQGVRSEEHTSELQSRGHLVCRLLLEKKNVQTQ